MRELAEKIIAALPAHAASLHITHNDHRSCYMTVAEYTATNQGAGEWRNPKALERATKSDEMWEAQWYPHTPIGFTRIAAPTLAELLEWLEEFKNEENKP